MNNNYPNHFKKFKNKRAALGLSDCDPDKREFWGKKDFISWLINCYFPFFYKVDSKRESAQIILKLTGESSLFFPSSLFSKISSIYHDSFFEDPKMPRLDWEFVRDIRKSLGIPHVEY